MSEVIGATSPIEAATGGGLWMAYTHTTGEAQTGRLHPDGSVTPLRSFPLDPLWSFIRPVGDGLTAFFSTGPGTTVSTGRFDSDGGFADLATTALGSAFHSVTALTEGRLLWNRVVHDGGVQRSVSVVGRIRPDGGHEFVSEPFLLDFWTHIVHVGSDRILFYNVHTGLAATGGVTPQGAFVDLGRSFHFDPWTTVLSTGDGKVLFHNASSGLLATGRVLDDGTFIDLHTQFVGTVRLTATNDDRYVIFRGADTLVSRLDEGGVFQDTRIVRGLPSEPQLVFVR